MKIQIPFVNKSVDATDPMEVVKTLAMVGVGFAMLFSGQELGGWLQSRVKSVLGVGSGQRPDLL
jgi:hypothetical protein